MAYAKVFQNESKGLYNIALYSPIQLISQNVDWVII